jgi:hypothetical protein
LKGVFSPLAAGLGRSLSRTAGLGAGFAAEGHTGSAARPSPAARENRERRIGRERIERRFLRGKRVEF